MAVERAAEGLVEAASVEEVAAVVGAAAVAVGAAVVAEA